MKHRAAVISVTILLHACSSNTSLMNKGIAVNPTPTTLWKVVEQIVHQTPADKVKLERVLMTNLRAERNSFNDLYYFFVSDPILLQNDVVLSQVRLAVKKDDSAVSSVGLGISGPCITRPQVTNQFGALTLIDAPRGRSLDEATTYSATMDGVALSFGFKERAPDCLAFVSIKSPAAR